MPLRARTLLGPGPSNPYPEATVALGEPLLGHLDPEFLRILDETSDRLAAGLRDDEPAHPPAVGDRIGRHGGVVRQHGRAGRRRRRGGQRPVRSADGRGRVAVRGRGRARGARVGAAGRRRSRARRPSVAQADRRGARRDLDGRAVRPGAARGRQGRRAAACRLRHVARRRPGAPRRLGCRPRLLRVAEVPGCRAWPRAVHDQRPGLGAADREAAELVPRPRAARRVRGGGGGLRSDLPPHRADGHGRLAARGPRPDPRRGPRSGACPARRGRPACCTTG